MVRTCDNTFVTGVSMVNILVSTVLHHQIGGQAGRSVCMSDAIALCSDY